MNDRDRFDRFTERARKVLSLAQEEAQRFQHNYIGTEHLLLGLVREREGVAARVLESLGVELYRVRQAVEFIIGRGDRIVLGEIGLTPRAKKVIELAVDEARRLNHHYIGTEHLLLGLVREGEGIAAGVLESLGVKLENVRTQTIQVLSGAAIRSAEMSWQADAEELAKIDREVANAQDEDDFTFAPSPFSDELLQNNIPRVFSVRALRVLNATREEARRLQNSYIGTEHLLLGLISEEKGLAAKIVQMTVELETIRSVLEFIIAHGGSRVVPDETGFTLRSRKVIQLAADEARKLGDPLVGAEHLLLGILREGEGIAAGVLISLGVRLQRVQTIVWRNQRQT